MPNKADLRREMRRLKAAHTASELQRLSEAAAGNLLRHPQWLAAHTVLLYHSLPDEVSTNTLLDAALAGDRTVLLPVVSADDLVVRRYDGAATLTPGAYNILEPTGADFTDYAAIDLAVVPGMAFTRQGLRLGRGKGYYDRLLPRLTNAMKIGLCWPFQLIDAIPAEAHDVTMDLVLTAGD